MQQKCRPLRLEKNTDVWGCATTMRQESKHGREPTRLHAITHGKQRDRIAVDSPSSSRLSNTHREDHLFRRFIGDHLAVAMFLALEVHLRSPRVRLSQGFPSWAGLQMHAECSPTTSAGWRQLAASFETRSSAMGTRIIGHGHLWRIVAPQCLVRVVSQV